MLGVNEKNKKTQIQSDFFEMLVCKNQENRPFLNVFQSAGNNFEEKKLGTIFGIIQVLDFSEDSEYLPNLLAQVIKKEFYRYPKEGSEQCFENALHKANLALADLARHNIVQWIGKLDAIVGVIFEDNVLLSQAGEGKAFLVRDKNFLEITQPAEESEVHPVKTFSEILSGKILPEDKLIFTGEEVFKALKKDELIRHSKVFNPHEFDNLIRSSLELEADNAGMIIVNVSEKQLYQYEYQPAGEDVPEDLNFFGSRPAEKKKSETPDNHNEKRKETAPGEEKIEKEKKDSLAFNSEFYIKEELEEEKTKEISGGTKERVFGFLVIIKRKLVSIRLPKKMEPEKFLDLTKKGIMKTSDYIRRIDYSKLKKIKVKQSHQEKIKNFFKKIWSLVLIAKDKIKVELILLRKKYRAHKENRERKKRLDKI